MLGRKVFAALPAGLASAIRKRARSRYGKADTVLGAFATPEQISWCAGRLARLAPDAILADTIFRAPVLRLPALAGLRRVMIAHDLFHVRHQALRAAGYSVYPESLTRETEAELLETATAIAAIQPEEAAAMRLLCPEKAVTTVPMPAVPCPRPDRIARIPDRLVFVGSATLPNIDGLRWLFAEIWPILKRLVPSVTLDLVGDCGGAFPLLPAGVSRLGPVKALSPILHRAALALAPMRVGSGLKIKILDYARHGLFTVATPESLAGFAPDVLAPFVAAATAADFTAAIAARLKQEPADSERLALDYVTRHYSVDESFAGLALALGLTQSA